MRAASASLEAHHAAARKYVLNTHRALELLESGQDTSLEMQSQISQDLNALARELEQLEEQLTYEGPERRKLWRKRISQLQDEFNSQRAALTRHASRARSQQREAEERDALLQVARPRA